MKVNSLEEIANYGLELHPLVDPAQIQEIVVHYGGRVTKVCRLMNKYGAETLQFLPTVVKGYDQVPATFTHIKTAGNGKRKIFSIEIILNIFFSQETVYILRSRRTFSTIQCCKTIEVILLLS